MGRLRINPERVLTAAERGKRFRDRRKGLPVPEAPRVMTAGRALAGAMEAAGVPLATADDLVRGSPTDPRYSGLIPERVVGPATPPRFDPRALIG